MTKVFFTVELYRKKEKTEQIVIYRVRLVAVLIQTTEMCSNYEFLCVEKSISLSNVRLKGMDKNCSVV